VHDDESYWEGRGYIDTYATHYVHVHVRDILYREGWCRQTKCEATLKAAVHNVALAESAAEVNIHPSL
jgi:hypothetical protein